MNVSTVQVQAASRLHFGLFAFGCEGAQRRNYGGVGMMITQPKLDVSFHPASRFTIHGPLSQRAEKFAQRWATFCGESNLPECEIQIRNVPPQHSGFGVGTQLGLSIAAGLNAITGREQFGTEQLAQATGRGARSAVGVHGFLRGGWIVEDGKLSSECLSPLLHRVEVPPAWRIVLIQQHKASGFFGAQERSTFADLPPVSVDTSQRLREEVSQQMLPALKQANFDAFSHSVSRYGEVAGGCFAAAQGGPYNGEATTKIVQTVRDVGVAGVGQSSWGPTIYCLLPNQSAAVSFVQDINGQLPHFDIHCVISEPNNHGALIEKSSGANLKSASLS